MGSYLRIGKGPGWLRSSRCPSSKRVGSGRIRIVSSNQVTANGSTNHVGFMDEMRMELLSGVKQIQQRKRIEIDRGAEDVHEASPVGESLSGKVAVPKRICKYKARGTWSARKSICSAALGLAIPRAMQGEYLRERGCASQTWRPHLRLERPLTGREASSENRWRDGYAWLGGGTWLFSEPQVKTDTLIDLASLGWSALSASAKGLDIAATCTIAELERFKPSAEWKAGRLLRECCRALLASFKIWKAACLSAVTAGGNASTCLPASPMFARSVGPEAVLTLWPRGGAPREVRAVDFVTGNHQNLLRPGELLRNIHLPAEALAKTYAFRRAS